MPSIVAWTLLVGLMILALSLCLKWVRYVERHKRRRYRDRWVDAETIQRRIDDVGPNHIYPDRIRRN